MYSGSTLDALKMKYFRESDPNHKRTESGAKNLGYSARPGYACCMYYCEIIVHYDTHDNHPASDDFSFYSLNLFLKHCKEPSCSR